MEHVSLIAGKTLVCAFFAILFLQSGLDKVTDRKGNLEWLTGHFANSPLKGMVGMMLSVITAVELAAGICCVGGIVGVYVVEWKLLTVLGPALACTALVMLFFGQRVAKDYPGAASLATYFGAGLIGMVICGTPG